VGIVLLLTGIVAWNCWEFYHGRNPWHNFFEPGRLRHPLRDLVDGCLFLVFVCCFVVFRVRSRKQRQNIKAESDWYRDLDAAVDIKDYEDQDSLYDYLGPDERKQLVRELQRMPKGSRSLHKAVQIVNPGLVE
jgi:hypothetical protein